MAENRTIKPQNVPPSLLKKLEVRYGPVDMEKDFFDRELQTYYKFSGIDPDTGGISHDIIRLVPFKDSFVKLFDAMKALEILTNHEDNQNNQNLKNIALELRNLFNRYRTYLRKNYPDQYEQIKNQLKEISTTGGGSGAATFTPGTGMQYATPKAFLKGKTPKPPKNMYGYKLVPEKIKKSGLEVKKLFEAESPKEFQDQRIAAFDLVREKLNDVYKLIDKGREDTIDYYQTNPASYAVVVATDLILDYLDDIKILLKGEEE